jgi:DNA-binding transcriptional LysR family regulator
VRESQSQRSGWAAFHAIFPQLLARIENRNVKFQLQISVGNSDELTADLEAGRLDVIIARRVAPAGERSSDVHAQKHTARALSLSAATATLPYRIHAYILRLYPRIHGSCQNVAITLEM